MAQVAIVMGSNSDLPVVQGAIDQLKSFGVDFEAHVISAHRTPQRAEEFAKSAKENGVKVIIAADTTLPVIALPIKSSFMDGLDSLLSMVQMPTGIPVATVGVNGADNAGILAVQMLAVSDSALAEKLDKFKADMAKAVEEKDKKLQDELLNKA